MINPDDPPNVEGHPPIPVQHGFARGVHDSWQYAWPWTVLLGVTAVLSAMSFLVKGLSPVQALGLLLFVLGNCLFVPIVWCTTAGVVAWVQDPHRRDPRNSSNLVAGILSQQIDEIEVRKVWSSSTSFTQFGHRSLSVDTEVSKITRLLRMIRAAITRLAMGMILTARTEDPPEVQASPRRSTVSLRIGQLQLEAKAQEISQLLQPSPASRISGRLRLSGNVLIQSKGVRIKADQVEFDLATGQIKPTADESHPVQLRYQDGEQATVAQAA